MFVFVCCRTLYPRRNKVQAEHISGQQRLSFLPYTQPANHALAFILFPTPEQISIDLDQPLDQFAFNPFTACLPHSLLAHRTSRRLLSFHRPFDAPQLTKKKEDNTPKLVRQNCHNQQFSYQSDLFLTRFCFNNSCVLFILTCLHILTDNFKTRMDKNST